jgi:hypothetical protein
MCFTEPACSHVTTVKEADGNNAVDRIALAVSLATGKFDARPSIAIARVLFLLCRENLKNFQPLKAGIR